MYRVVSGEAVLLWLAAVRVGVVPVLVSFCCRPELLLLIWSGACQHVPRSLSCWPLWHVVLAGACPSLLCKHHYLSSGDCRAVMAASRCHSNAVVPCNSMAWLGCNRVQGLLSESCHGA